MYYKSGDLHLKPALLIALGLAIGATIGAQFATHIDAMLLKRGFAVLMVVMAVKMWVG